MNDALRESAADDGTAFFIGLAHAIVMTGIVAGAGCVVWMLGRSTGWF